MLATGPDGAQNGSPNKYSGREKQDEAWFPNYSHPLKAQRVVSRVPEHGVERAIRGQDPGPIVATSAAEPCGANRGRAERDSAKRSPDDHMDYHRLRGPSRGWCRSAPRGPAAIAAALWQPQSRHNLTPADDQPPQRR